MKSSIVSSREATPKYPRFMRHILGDKFIVLEISPNKGVVVYTESRDNICQFGKLHDNLTIESFPEDWEQFYGTIKISSE